MSRFVIRVSSCSHLFDVQKHFLRASVTKCVVLLAVGNSHGELLWPDTLRQSPCFIRQTETQDFFNNPGIGWYVGLTPGVAAAAAGVVSFGEVLAEIIGLDDNLVIPMLGVLGVRVSGSLPLHSLKGVVIPLFVVQLKMSQHFPASLCMSS